MEEDRSLEWLKSMRMMILGSLFDLSSRHLQAASWNNPNNDNPYYSLIEFIHESSLNDPEYLVNHKDNGVINDDEYAVLLRLSEALIAYSPPDGDWYDYDAVFEDDNWRTITETAESVLDELLSLSFNSPHWLGK